MNFREFFAALGDARFADILVSGDVEMINSFREKYIASGIDAKTILEGSRIFEEFKGVLTEQYVLQELVSDCQITPYYYTEPKSSGEIDFVIQSESNVIPIEVKAAKTCRQKV